MAESSSVIGLFSVMTKPSWLSRIPTINPLERRSVIMNPREDLKAIAEFIASVATEEAVRKHGRLQVRYQILDLFDDYITVAAGPAINGSTRSEEEQMDKALKKTPIGQPNTEYFASGRSCPPISYRIPLKFFPIEFRARRGKSISGARRLAEAVGHSSCLRGERSQLGECKEKLEKLKNIKAQKVSPVVAAIEHRLVAIKAELARSEREEELMDKEGMGKQNELLFIDIARHLGLEEGPSVSLLFSVKRSSYPLAPRRVPYGPTGCE